MKKNNIGLIALIILIFAITVGVISWLFSREQRTELIEKRTVSIQPNDSAELSQKIIDEKVDFTIKTADKGAIVYKSGKNIVSYNPENKQEKIIFSDDKLLDFDITVDGNFLAYSLSESGFQGNSDIYLIDIKNKKTIRLTEKNNIASSSPRIYSGGKKVAYLRKTFETKVGKLRDGEIWTIDASGDPSTSSKLYGDESNSWFDMNPKDRCCDTCEGDDKPYEPKNMLEFKSISEDGNIISYKKGSFSLICFAGFNMDDGTYDVKNKKELDYVEMLPSKDKQYYAELYSRFPSDPFPFCIKNSFFDKDGKVVWNPDSKIADECQHDYYYRPLDFQIMGDQVNMVYVKKLGDGSALAEGTFNTDSDPKILKENPSDVLYQPKIYYTEDGKNINYMDNILAARKLGKYIVFLESKFTSKFPIINILDTTTKKIVKNISLDNDLGFEFVLSN